MLVLALEFSRDRGSRPLSLRAGPARRARQHLRSSAVGGAVGRAPSVIRRARRHRRDGQVATPSKRKSEVRLRSQRTRACRAGTHLRRGRWRPGIGWRAGGGE
jgi:hypothetical protein